jgi:dTDP-4-amino-4,6-dideoxy-D-galactose acyltransferase
VTEACHLLPWDTEFFGFPVARVASDRLTATHIHQIEQWCADRQIHCLYFLARADDAQTTRLAEDQDYRLVDVRLVFERKLAEAPPASTTRPAQPGDLPALKKIARTSYRDTRFYFDTRFPPGACDRLYETWIERSCLGEADAVLVMDSNTAAAGYITCHIDSGSGRIGLVGVGADARGRGVGQALVRSALAWFSERSVHTVTVVTQGRNVAAQRLYQRCGFLAESVHLWYHKWFL